MDDDRVRWLYVFAAGLIVLASILLSLVSLDEGHGWGGDFAQYILQARSLSEGSTEAFIEESRFTILHSSASLAPVAYPWGLPALLVPVYLSSGLELLPLKAVGTVSGWLALIVTAALARRWLPAPWALVLLAFVAFNRQFFTLQNYIGADVPFMFASLATLALIGRSVVDDARIISRRWDAVAIGVGMGAALLLRPNGLLLLPALAAAQIFAAFGASSGAPAPRARRLDSSHVIPYLTFVGIVALGSLSTAPDPTASRIVEHLGPGLLEAISANGPYYAGKTLAYFKGVPGAAGWMLLGACLALIGVSTRLRSEPHWVAFTALTVSLLLVFPYEAGARALLPIVPFWAGLAFAGVLRLLALLPSSLQVVAGRGAIAVAAVVPIALAWSAIGAAAGNLERDRNRGIGSFTPLATEMFEFVQEHTPAESRVLFPRPRIMRLRAERASFSSRAPEHVAMADYIVVSATMEQSWGIEPELIESLQSGDRFERVWSNVLFDVYARVSD